MSSGFHTPPNISKGKRPTGKVLEHMPCMPETPNSNPSTTYSAITTECGSETPLSNAGVALEDPGYPADPRWLNITRRPSL